MLKKYKLLSFFFVNCLLITIILPRLNQKEEPTMQYNTFKELSTANYSPDYRPGLSGGLTNGNIVVGGHKYSDDGGATWNDVTDTSLEAQYTASDVGCIQIQGNTVYKVIGPGSLTDKFVMYKSTDGITYAKVGANIDPHLQDGSPANKTYYPIICGSFSTLNSYEVVIFLRVDDISGDSDEIICLFNYPTGWKVTDGIFNFGKIQSFPANETWYPAVRRSYGDESGSGIIFTLMVKNSSSGAEYLRIEKYVLSPAGFSTLYDCQGIDTDQELRIDYSDSDFNYVSKNAFAETIEGDYVIAGDLYDDDGGAVDNGDATVKYDHSADTLTKILSTKINPIDGVGDRMWGYEIDGSQIYISFNEGDTFFLLETTTSRSWEGGVEFEDSYLGFGVFDAGKFYTLQENTETLIKKTVVSEFQTNSRAYIIGNIDWPSNQVLFLYDYATPPVLSFRGLSVKEGGQEAERWYDFVGLDSISMNSKITVDYSTSATGTHTIARAMVDQVPHAYWDATSIPDHGLTMTTAHDGDLLKDGLKAIADYIDGVWEIEPDGKVWLVKNTALPNTSITITENSSGITAPEIEGDPRTPNYINLYGQDYINVVVKDEESIKLKGEIEINRYYPGIADISKLTSMGASLLARDGITTPPLLIWFYRVSQNYLMPGSTMNYKWDFITKLKIAADYPIQKMVYDDRRGATIFLTNTTYQEDN